MKKAAVMMVFMMVTVLASAAMAGPGGPGKEMIGIKTGQLFLFQKCDDSGCPTEAGPWPILLTGRWGQLHYNLLGEKFWFAFEGKKLEPNTKYTLIYYPDPWPGENLVCLGSGKSSRAGNLQIHGGREILDLDGNHSGLPAKYDGNFLPQGTSGAIGAKIWLVPSADVDCDGEPDATPDPVPPQMIGWTPEDYLFEGNLIVYQYQSRD